MSPDGLDACFIDGALPQGLATSPVLSNIAMISIDEDIYTLLSDHFFSLQKNQPNNMSFAYTRYADDLSISLNPLRGENHRHTAVEIIKCVTRILASHGFEINNKKMRIMTENNGYRTITGISVNHYEIKATRKILRRIRSSLHKSEVSRAGGLMNWVSQIKRAR